MIFLIVFGLLLFIGIISCCFAEKSMVIMLCIFLIIVSSIINFVYSNNVVNKKIEAHEESFNINNYTEEQIQHYKNMIVVCNKINVKKDNSKYIINYKAKNYNFNFYEVLKNNTTVTSNRLEQHKSQTGYKYIEVYEFPDQLWSFKDFNKWTVDGNFVPDTNYITYYRIYE